MPKPCKSTTTALVCTATSPCGRTAAALPATRKGYAGLSDLARWYIGGLIKHSSSVLAFTNPVPELLPPSGPGLRLRVGQCTPLVTRSVASVFRWPVPPQPPSASSSALRIRPCNPFLASRSADGWPGRHPEPHRASEPIRQGFYELPPEEHAGIKQVPSSLAEAMDARKRTTISSPPATCSPTT